MKPILFNTDTVHAFQNGTKTATRRVVKPQPADTDDCQHEMQTYDQMLPQFYKDDYSCACRKCGYGTQQNGKSIFQPPYRPGDILYVRETFDELPVKPDGELCSAGTCLYYKADGDLRPKGWKANWRPSIHMPREAARIFLQVTDVRVERLWDMTNNDLVNDFGLSMDAIVAVGWDTLGRAVWDSTIKPIDRAIYGWDANPWVWVIEFERCDKPKGD